MILQMPTACGQAGKAQARDASVKLDGQPSPLPLPSKAFVAVIICDLVSLGDGDNCSSICPANALEKAGLLFQFVCSSGRDIDELRASDDSCTA